MTNVAVVIEKTIITNCDYFVYGNIIRNSKSTRNSNSILALDEKTEIGENQHKLD